MIIKVCGMREPKNIHAVVQLGVDMIGFVYSKENPRYVGMISSRAGIIPDYSSLYGPAVPTEELGQPLRVGVFVDEMPQTIVTRIYNDQLDYVQLNGSESPVMIDNLRRTVDPDIRPGIQIIKTLFIQSREDLALYKLYEGHVDMFIFEIDGLNKQNIRAFERSLLETYSGETPFLLGGNILSDVVTHIMMFSHPRFSGINLTTTFEAEPGTIDVEKLEAFLKKIRR